MEVLAEEEEVEGVLVVEEEVWEEEEEDLHHLSSANHHLDKAGQGGPMDMVDQVDMAGDHHRQEVSHLALDRVQEPGTVDQYQYQDQDKVHHHQGSTWGWFRPVKIYLEVRMRWTK